MRYAQRADVAPQHLGERASSRHNECCWAVSFSDGRNDLPTAIRGPPPPRVAHSTPLGLLYLGTHALLRRAAGSVVAPGFVVSPRPSGASFKGVCMRLGGFPVPRRKAHRRVPSPSGLKKISRVNWSRQLHPALQQRGQAISSSAKGTFAGVLAEIKSIDRIFCRLSTAFASPLPSARHGVPSVCVCCVSLRGSRAAGFRESRPNGRSTT